MDDQVDKILAQWANVHPELDCSAMGVVGRLRRTNQAWQKQMETVFKQHGLSSIEFDILATMRRTDMPVTPTELYQTLMLSSGAVSTRIEQLVQRGYVERIASTEDRRSCKVKLTPQGITLLDEALYAHQKNMEGMLNVLDKQEQAQLAHLLKKVMAAE